MKLSRTITGHTPRQDGYHMPAEYEEHCGCWLLWPERPDNWRLNARPAQQAIIDLARTLAYFESVRVGVSSTQYTHARSILPPQIAVVEMPFDDSWARDTGPTCVINSEGNIPGNRLGFQWLGR